MSTNCGFASLLLMGTAHAAPAVDPPGGVQFSQSATTIDAYDFVEVTAAVDAPTAANPFTDVAVEGSLTGGGAEPLRVDGFCDSQDGSVFRIRFMPTVEGEHRYSVTFRQGDFQATHEGTFTARDAGRKGLVRVDADHPWHFVWEGTGEHYFWNGTTTYFIMGCKEALIRQSLDRLHRLQVNRIRAVIMGRVKDGRAWYEDVFPTDEFSFLLNPWVAQRPDSVEKPGFEVTRFNVAYWQKYDRLLRHARELDMVVSVIPYVDGRRPGVDPFGKGGAGGPDEQRFYRYAAARFSAFSNAMWDVTNEYHLFRDEDWANKMGAFLSECDPYDHLMSVHGHGEFPFRTSPWADFAMHQKWDEAGGYAFVRGCRDKQMATGRIIPQVNEEYGYEDHYPKWGGNRKWPTRTADNRRRLAWQMYLAGGYQTTGERANAGDGGGWINGRGDDSMVMLEGYGRIVDFFTSIPWWTLDPDDELVSVREDSPVRMELTHLAYTRDKDGQATLYVDGKEVSRATVSGEVSNWDDGFRLALANELTGDRPWLGEYRRVALFDRAVPSKEVADSFAAGLAAKAEAPLVLYTFDEGDGKVVRDTSGNGDPLDLTVANAEAVRWSPGGLSITGKTLVASAGPATKVTTAIKQSGAFTLEAWVKPANTTQDGPARIVTLSKDPSNRSFTVGQGGTAYEVRFRTTNTSTNGEPSLWSPGAGKPAKPVYALRSESGDLAVLYFARGGEAQLNRPRLVENTTAQWYNPRDGSWSPAEAADGDVFRAPDGEDWALLLKAP